MIYCDEINPFILYILPIIWSLSGIVAQDATIKLNQGTVVGVNTRIIIIKIFPLQKIYFF